MRKYQMVVKPNASAYLLPACIFGITKKMRHQKSASLKIDSKYLAHK